MLDAGGSSSGLGSTTVTKPGKYRPEDEFEVLGGNASYANNMATQANQNAGLAAAEQNGIRGNAETSALSATRNQTAAQNRANPAAAQIARSGQTGTAQGGLADRLRAFAEAPEGPSAAQATLRSGTNQALSSQLALARSSGGFGENASSLNRAAGNAAGIQAGGANEAARLRADETARYKDRQLQGFRASGDVLSDQRSGTMAEANSELMAQQQRDATALGYSAERRADLGLASDASQRGLQGSQEGQKIGLETEKSALEGRLRGAQTESDIYQAEMENAAEHRRQDRQRDKDWVEGATGVVSSLGGLLSDVRMKKDIVTLDDPGENGDPSGDYFALADDNFSMKDRRDERRERYERNDKEEGGKSGLMGAMGAMRGMMSDERSKKRIRELESIKDEYESLFDGPPATRGVPKRDVPNLDGPEGRPDYSNVGTYEYSYKEPEKFGKGRYVGPMAQELEHIPGVVKPTPQGEKVDAGRLTMANTSELAAQRRELDRMKAEFDALYDRPPATRGMR